MAVPKHQRRKYQNKGTDHTGGPPCGKGKHHMKNRDHTGKKVKTKGRFPSIRARIARRNTILKKNRLGKV